jgi:hypothetical protein
MTSTLSVRITVRGRLDDGLAATFEGMTAARRQHVTDLVGEVVDEAQLYGLLARVRDLGLRLEAVTVTGSTEVQGAEGQSGREGRTRW